MLFCVILKFLGNRVRMSMYMVNVLWCSGDVFFRVGGIVLMVIFLFLLVFRFGMFISMI